MRKTEELNNLFAKWEEEVEDYKGHFVKDGIINEELWDKEGNSQILFVTKEPNNTDQYPGDFRQWWMQEEISHSFTYRIAEWSFGLQNGFPPYDEVRQNRVETKKALQSVALMNIKKTGGAGAIHGGVLNAHFELNKSFLKQQLEIINPKIIILCISWNNIVKQGLFPDAKWQPSGYDINVANWNGKKMIDFYHPSARNAPSASYSLLQNVIKGYS